MTPVSRRDTGRQAASGALALARRLRISVPYLWFLGRDVGPVGDALATGFPVGTLLAISLASPASSISVSAASNRVSLSISLFVLLALLAPTQLPATAQHGWAGDLLLRLNPLTAGEHYVGKIVTNGHPWSQDISCFLAAGCRRGLLGSGSRRRRKVHRPERRWVRMTRFARLALLVVVLLLTAAQAQAAGLRVVHRAAIATALGHKFVFHTTIRNEGATPATGLIAHLNVVDLERPHLRRPRGLVLSAHALPSFDSPRGLDGARLANERGQLGDDRRLRGRPAAEWGSGSPRTGPTVRVRIKDRKTLNSRGILPLALGLPALLGLVAVGVRLRRGR